MHEFDEPVPPQAYSAPVARERLQVLLAHERAFVGKSDLLAVLQEEIIAVIAKHVTIERERVQIKLDRGDPISTLEIDVEVPSAAAAAALRESTRRRWREAEALFRRQQARREILARIVASGRCRPAGPGSRSLIHRASAVRPDPPADAALSSRQTVGGD